MKTSLFVAMLAVMACTLISGCKSVTFTPMPKDQWIDTTIDGREAQVKVLAMWEF